MVGTRASRRVEVAAALEAGTDVSPQKQLSPVHRTRASSKAKAKSSAKTTAKTIAKKPTSRPTRASNSPEPTATRISKRTLSKRAQKALSDLVEEKEEEEEAEQEQKQTARSPARSHSHTPEVQATSTISQVATAPIPETSQDIIQEALLLEEEDLSRTLEPVNSPSIITQVAVAPVLETVQEPQAPPSQQQPTPLQQQQEVVPSASPFPPLSSQPTPHLQPAIAFSPGSVTSPQFPAEDPLERLFPSVETTFSPMEQVPTLFGFAPVTETAQQTTAAMSQQQKEDTRSNSPLTSRPLSTTPERVESKSTSPPPTTSGRSRMRSANGPSPSANRTGLSSSKPTRSANPAVKERVRKERQQEKDAQAIIKDAKRKREEAQRDSDTDTELPKPKKSRTSGRSFVAAPDITEENSTNPEAPVAEALQQSIETLPQPTYPSTEEDSDDVPASSRYRGSLSKSVPPKRVTLGGRINKSMRNPLGVRHGASLGARHGSNMIKSDLARREFGKTPVPRKTEEFIEGYEDLDYDDAHFDMFGRRLTPVKSQNGSIRGNTLPARAQSARPISRTVADDHISEDDEDFHISVGSQSLNPATKQAVAELSPLQKKVTRHQALGREIESRMNLIERGRSGDLALAPSMIVFFNTRVQEYILTREQTEVLQTLCNHYNKVGPYDHALSPKSLQTFLDQETARGEAQRYDLVALRSPTDANRDSQSPSPEPSTSRRGSGAGAHGSNGLTISGRSSEVQSLASQAEHVSTPEKPSQPHRGGDMLFSAVKSVLASPFKFFTGKNDAVAATTDNSTPTATEPIRYFNSSPPTPGNALHARTPTHKPRRLQLTKKGAQKPSKRLSSAKATPNKPNSSSELLPRQRPVETDKPLHMRGVVDAERIAEIHREQDRKKEQERKKRRASHQARVENENENEEAAPAAQPGEKRKRSAPPPGTYCLEYSSDEDDSETSAITIDPSSTMPGTFSPHLQTAAAATSGPKQSNNALENPLPWTFNNPNPLNKKYSTKWFDMMMPYVTATRNGISPNGFYYPPVEVGSGCMVVHDPRLYIDEGDDRPWFATEEKWQKDRAERDIIIRDWEEEQLAKNMPRWTGKNEGTDFQFPERWNGEPPESPSLPAAKSSDHTVESASNNRTLSAGATPAAALFTAALPQPALTARQQEKAPQVLHGLGASSFVPTAQSAQAPKPAANMFAQAPKPAANLFAQAAPAAQAPQAAANIFAQAAQPSPLQNTQPSQLTSDFASTSGRTPSASDVVGPSGSPSFSGVESPAGNASLVAGEVEFSDSLTGRSMVNVGSSESRSTPTKVLKEKKLTQTPPNPNMPSGLKQWQPVKPSLLRNMMVASSPTTEGSPSVNGGSPFVSSKLAVVSSPMSECSPGALLRATPPEEGQEHDENNESGMGYEPFQFDLEVLEALEKAPESPVFDIHGALTNMGWYKPSNPLRR